MDRVFDHEDPNNRLEEIPMDDLGSYDEDNDDDDEYFDAYDLDMMETTFSSGGMEMFDKEGRPILHWLIVQNIKKFKGIVFYRKRLIL